MDFFDALLVALYSQDASIVMPNNGDISLGDVNADGQVDLVDAWLIAAYLNDSSDPSLPAGIGEPVGPAASLSPDPSTVTLADDGAWHRFTVVAGEPVLVVVNPEGTTPRLEITTRSGRRNYCPAEVDDGVSRRDGQTLYLAGCATGPAVVELRRRSDDTVLNAYTLEVTGGPETVATIPGQTLVVSAGATTIRLGAAFAHPNSDVLTYSAFSADENVTRIGMSGATLSITPVAEGATTVTVTATDSEGLGASLAFPVTVEHPAPRLHNIVLRVVHVTTDWLPYATWGGWPAAAHPKESAALKYFEVAIWDETASVHLYEFDNDFKLWHDAGTDPARIAYREQYVVRKHSGMPSDWIARQDFVKSALVDFATYIAERFPDSDHHLVYSGHGGPGGQLFAGLLSQEGAAEFLGTWRVALGRRLGVIDMGGPCNKGALSDLENFCGHARYYIASDLTNGGYDFDDWTGEKWDEVDPDRQRHALLARNADLETALKEQINLRRKRYEYSRQDMIANKVEQANYLYSCTDFRSELGWSVRLFVDESGGGYGYGSDLRQYLTDNDAPRPLLEMFDDAILHDATNRDFFPWEEVANGIMMCCPH